jgi:hypothetical protein
MFALPVFLTAGLFLVSWFQPISPSPAAYDPQAALRSRAIVVMPPESVHRVLERRIQAKTLLIEQLIKAELTLLEAASCFRQLNEGHADFQDFTWQKLPGSSDGEKLCRQVLIWFHAALEHLPKEQRGSVKARVQGEFDRLLSGNATIVVP